MSPCVYFNYIVITHPAHPVVPLRRQMSRVRHGGKVVGAASVLGALGVGVSDLTHFWFHFPTLEAALTSRWLLAYVALSFLIGVAVTYYWDNEGDAKAHTILRAALRILGAVLVAYATHQLWEAAAASVALLVAALWLTPRARESAVALAPPPGPVTQPHYAGPGYYPPAGAPCFVTGVPASFASLPSRRTMIWALWGVT